MAGRRGITRQDETSKTLFEYSELEVYQRILDGDLRGFPFHFWNGEDGYKRGIKIIKYLFEKVLVWSIDNIIEKANNQLLYEYKLRSLLFQRFENNATEAIMSAYPELREQKKKIFDDVKEYALKVERIPTSDEVYRIHKEEVISFYFSSYMNMMYIIKNEYTKEDLLTILKNKATRDHKVPEMKDMRVPQAIIYLREFGTWDNVLKEAGM